MVLFSNWCTLRSKGSKMKLSLILTKIDILGFFDMLQLNMYLDFLLWAKFASWSKSGFKIKIFCLISTNWVYGVLQYAEFNNVFYIFNIWARLSNWFTLRSKGYKIEPYLISSKIEFLGFYDKLNLTMYLDFGYWTIIGKCPI